MNCSWNSFNPKRIEIEIIGRNKRKKEGIGDEPSRIHGLTQDSDAHNSLSLFIMCRWNLGSELIIIMQCKGSESLNSGESVG